jgi:ABC-type transport system substrate-binding protein
MEANESYWRKVPSVKRLVFKSVPDSTTRLAMLINRYPWSAPLEEVRLKRP